MSTTHVLKARDFAIRSFTIFPRPWRSSSVVSNAVVRERSVAQPMLGLWTLRPLCFVVFHRISQKYELVVWSNYGMDVCSCVPRISGSKGRACTVSCGKGSHYDPRVRDSRRSRSLPLCPHGSSGCNDAWQPCVRHRGGTLSFSHITYTFSVIDKLTRVTSICAFSFRDRVFMCMPDPVCRKHRVFP